MADVPAAGSSAGPAAGPAVGTAPLAPPAGRARAPGPDAPDRNAEVTAGVPDRGPDVQTDVLERSAEEPADVLVIGAGLAGARCCERLRAAGFTGRIVLVGAEPDLPYDRPPLTSEPGADTDLARTMGIDVRLLADDVLLGLRAIRLDAAAPAGSDLGWLSVLSAGSGGPRRLSARVVVAATGASPARPRGWRHALLLHTRRDADDLWSRVDAGARLVVVGGGWIGCEVAMTAGARGARVLLVEAAPQLLAGRVPPSVAARVGDLLAGAGVDVRVGLPVTGVALEGAGVAVRTPEGPLGGDIALAALGVRPETSWLPERLERSGDGAVLTDPWGRTGLPGLFALGDAAARWSPRAGLHLPGGHWTEAFGCAETVAPAIASWLRGKPDPARWSEPSPSPADDAIPYTFSDLGQRRRLLVLGDAAQGREIWRERAGGWTMYTVDDRGRLAGVVSLGRPRDVVAARAAMRRVPVGRPWVDEAALADPDAPPDRCFPAGDAPDER